MEQFLKRVKDMNKNKKIDSENIQLAYQISKFERKELPKPESCSFDETIEISKKILSTIDPHYSELLGQMIEEQDCDKPVLYVFHATSLEENLSLTFQHEISFYKTDTVYDPFFLLHEFTHFLMNQGKKKRNEVFPILMEFIVKEELQNDEFLSFRFNKTILDAKSILFKSEILRGISSLSGIQKKYHFTKEEMDTFLKELQSSKSLSCDEEVSYLKGFLTAISLSKNAKENFIKYHCNIEELPTIDWNQSLEELQNLCSEEKNLI